jgi:hypothetical protein
VRKWKRLASVVDRGVTGARHRAAGLGLAWAQAWATHKKGTAIPLIAELV